MNSTDLERLLRLQKILEEFNLEAWTVRCTPDKIELLPPDCFSPAATFVFDEVVRGWVCNPLTQEKKDV